MGVAANSATRISPVRGDPPRTWRPSRASAYEQTTPDTIVTVNADVTRPIPPPPSRAANQRTTTG
jgi:hypothetical protein